MIYCKAEIAEIVGPGAAGNVDHGGEVRSGKGRVAISALGLVDDVLDFASAYKSRFERFFPMARVGCVKVTPSGDEILHAEITRDEAIDGDFEPEFDPMEAV